MLQRPGSLGREDQQATATPASCFAGGVKIKADSSPATVSVTDTTTSTAVQVVVTITGTTFAITPVDSSLTLTSATWCLKASTQTQNGTGTTGTRTITNKKGVTQKISYLVVYSLTSDPIGSCWDNTGPAADLTYFGPINTLGNALTVASFDGTCTGDPFGPPRTIVRASDEAAAAALCTTLGYTGARDLRDFGYVAAPADFWVCGGVPQ